MDYLATVARCAEYEAHEDGGYNERRFPQGGNRLKFSLITDGGDRLSIVEFHVIAPQPGNGRAVFIEGRFAENRIVAAAVKGDY